MYDFFSSFIVLCFVWYEQKPVYEKPIFAQIERFLTKRKTSLFFFGKLKTETAVLG